MDVACGDPGRANDAGVFNRSTLSRSLQQCLHVQNRSLLESYHIVADSAYPLKKYIMTTFKKKPGQDLTPAEHLFNRHVSSKRQVLNVKKDITFSDFYQ